MSLLTIVQNAANEIGFTAPSSVVGSTDETAVRMLRSANRAGKILSKKDWPELVKEHTFTTVASTAQYALPTDFRAPVLQTAWNRTLSEEMFPISSRQWQAEKSGNVTVALNNRFRFFGTANTAIGKLFTIHPTPSAAEDMVYEYYSENWVISGGTEYDTWQADSDTTVFDEDLVELAVIWRFLKSLGQPYQEEKTEYDHQLSIAMAGSQSLDIVRTDGHFETLQNIPETGFGT